MKDSKSIDVCVCTFRRQMVAETLLGLDRMAIPADTKVRVIVVDNDIEPSAENIVRETSEKMQLEVVYRHAPAGNISIARNACLDTAEADWVAFIDDDSTPDEDWLTELQKAALATGADAVFGPSLARYPDDAPTWLVENDFLSTRQQRDGGEIETGFTGNVLIVRRAGMAEDQRFVLSLGRTGGEDMEYFFRLKRNGARFEACETAVVYEAVPRERLNLRWVVRRKYREGWNYAFIKRIGRKQIDLKEQCLGVLRTAFCAVCAVITVFHPVRRAYWAARAGFHLGKFRGGLSHPAVKSYGLNEGDRLSES